MKSISGMELKTGIYHTSVVVVWAVNRVFVGIAEDVKGIRDRLEKD
jgi:hypothetical protein